MNAWTITKKTLSVLLICTFITSQAAYPVIENTQTKTSYEQSVPGTSVEKTLSANAALTSMIDAKNALISAPVVSNPAAQQIIIHSVFELQNISQNLNAHYVLANNIDASATKTWNGGLGFDSIDNFAGIFDGQGYTISNLYINRPNEEFVGLFGNTAIGAWEARVIDTHLESVSINGGYSLAGGLVGALYYGTIERSSVTGTINCTGNIAGGLVGYNGRYGTILQSIASATVAATRPEWGFVAGGLVGYNSGYIYDSYSTSNVSCDNVAGGLAGLNYAGGIYRSYSTGRVVATGSFINKVAGGLVGHSGGYNGDSGHPIVLDSYWDIEASGVTTSAGGTGKTTAQMMDASTFKGWDISYGSGHTWIMAGYPHLQWEWTDTITNASQLQMVTLNPNAKYTIANNIDASDTKNWNAGLGFESIANFTGIFDGKNKIISNLYINRPTENYVGLFGSTRIGQPSGAKITDTRLESVSITGHDNVGGLFGILIDSVIERSSVTGTIKGHEFVGGLVGQNRFSTIRQSFASANVIAKFGVGGLVGDNFGDIYDSYSTSNVSSSYDLASRRSDAGGLVGWNGEVYPKFGRVYRSYSTGKVTNSQGGLVGGLIGGSDSDPVSSIFDSYWDVNTSGVSTSAGGTGKTTAQMMDASTFKGWDISYDSGHTWIMAGYPHLQWEWTDTITNASQLQMMTLNPNAKYIVANDINVSTTKTWNGGQGFKSVGTALNPFAGSLSGNNHIIRGLYINLIGTNDFDYVGLFGYTAKSSLLRDIDLRDADIIGKGRSNYRVMGPTGLYISSVGGTIYAGALAGHNSGEIINCDVLGGDITGIAGDGANAQTGNWNGGVAYSGGLVGYNDGGSISGGSVDADVIATGGRGGQDTYKYYGGYGKSGAAYSGGLIGYSNSGSIGNVATTGNVKANGGAGCPGYSTSDGADSYAGGLIGFQEAGAVYSVSSTSNVTSVAGNGGSGYYPSDGADSYAGGLIAFKKEGTLNNASASGNVVSTAGKAGVCTNNYPTFAGTSYIGGLAGKNSQSGITGITNSYASKLYNVLDLQLIKYKPTGTFTVMGDIDASDTKNWNAGAGFESIANFNGIFDGKNKVISNLYINRPSTSYIGLFARNTGTIMKTILKNANIIGHDCVGTLVGINLGGRIYNSIASAIVKGHYYVGGLAGHNTGTIAGSSAAGAVSGSSYVGGLNGFNSGVVSSSYATGDVTGNAAGGLVGYNSGTIMSSYARGAMKGYSYLGGLIGQNYGLISSCYSTGAVSGTFYIGGLVGFGVLGRIYNSYATGTVNGYGYLGGLAGLNYGEIVSSYATGSVIGTQSYIGGLVGYNTGTITSSYARGAVKGYSYVGGLVGRNNGTIRSNSWSTALVNGYYGVGGLVGLNYGVISASCTLLDKVTGTYYVGGLVGMNYGSILSNAWSSATVSGYYGVGGLCGYNYGVISNAYAQNAAVTGTYYAGGLAGMNYGKIIGAWASGLIKGTYYVGGLTGSNWGTITSSSGWGYAVGTYYVGGLCGLNYGTISASYAVGALVGVAKGTYYVGGLVGGNWGTIVSSSARGAVNGYAYTGGLVGLNYGTISSAYATGAVTGTYYIGGLAGLNYGRIYNSLATGVVKGYAYVGGLVGGNWGLIYKCRAFGRVFGSYYVGQLVGYNRGTIIY